MDDNLRAIRVVKQLEREGRHATQEEQQQLVRYVGWGGLAELFIPLNELPNDVMRERAEALRALLTEDEYDSAKRSVNYAFYTPSPVIQSIYEGLQHLGVTRGRFLEPGSGIGLFCGLMPEAMRANSVMCGIERDSISARIAHYLYPTHRMIEGDYAELQLGENAFDVVVGNVPFGDVKIVDSRSRLHDGRSIHNYFLCKSIDALRAGGVTAIVTSRYFLDSQSTGSREYIATRCELLAAFRLPAGAFAENAGTDVTCDILFLQKRPEKEWLKAEALEKVSWLTHGEIRGFDEDRGLPAVLRINDYFTQFPAHVLGQWTLTRHGQYGAKDLVCVAREGEDWRQLLHTRMLSALPANRYDAALVRETTRESLFVDNAIMQPADGETVGSFTIDTETGQLIETTMSNGVPTRRVLVPATLWTERKALGQDGYDKLARYVKIRDALLEQIAMERDDHDVDVLDAHRHRLRQALESFQARHGYLNERSNRLLLRSDPKWLVVASLESEFDPGITREQAKKAGVQPVAPSAKLATILTRRAIFPTASVDSAAGPEEALTISLTQRGCVDSLYMGRLLKTDANEVIRQLSEREQPLVYFEPYKQRWESARDYLSGDIAEKIRRAQAAGLNKNVAALEAVLPPRLSAADIKVGFGVSWIPPKYYEQFAAHLFGASTQISVMPVEAIGGYLINAEGGGEVEVKEVWGVTDRYDGHWLFDRMLNSKPVLVYDYIDEKPVLNRELTDQAALKATELISAWQDWVFRDADRREFVVETYNTLFNSIVPAIYDGETLDFPGKVPDEIIRFRRHQRNAIMRGMMQDDLLLHHAVGSGKTYTAEAIIMKRRQAGITSKAMMVVPKHLVEQQVLAFLTLYPGANVLAPREDDFSAKNRQLFLSRIATGDWDCVVLSGSQFKLIQNDPEIEAQYIEERLDRLKDGIKAASNLKGKRLVKQMEKTGERLEGKLKRLRRFRKDNLLTFQDLGIDYLVVDESDLYKNLEYVSSMRNVAGLGNPEGSQMAFDMYIKSRDVRSRGGAFHTMTATPISNSAVELYTMMRYHGEDVMHSRGINMLDSFVKQFGDVSQDVEMDATGMRFTLRTRLRTFNNVPELMRLYRSFADIVTIEDVKAAYREEYGRDFPMPKTAGGGMQAVVTNPSSTQRLMIKNIITRALALEGKFGEKPEPSEDNFLKLSTDSRKLSLDPRLLDATIEEDSPKLLAMRDNVVRLLDKYPGHRGTILVFCDMGIPLSQVKKFGQEMDDAFLRLQQAQAVYENLLEENSDADAIGKAEEALTDARKAWDEFGPSQIAAYRAAKQGYSVYDEGKRLLVDAGVAENEVAFIHDYDTPDKRLKLYDMVNRGVVRVLWGSTARMGAGTNVQKRLVGMLHLDCPWRPRDVEQRNGRGERQGNDLNEIIPNFEIENLAVITVGTYDAKTWQLVQIKGEIVNAILKVDISDPTKQRVIHDDEVAESVSSEELMAAADASISTGEKLVTSFTELSAKATGNPLLAEEIRLKKEIRQLEAAEGLHQRKKWGVEDVVRRYDKWLASHPAKIAQLQADWDRFTPHRTNPHHQLRLAADIEGQKFTDFKSAFSHIETLAESRRDAAENGRYRIDINGESYSSVDACKSALTELFGDAMPFLFVARNDVTQPVERRLLRRSLCEGYLQQTVRHLAREGIEKPVSIGSFCGFDVVIEVYEQQGAYASRHMKPLRVDLSVLGTLEHQTQIALTDEIYVDKLSDLPTGFGNAIMSALRRSLNDILDELERYKNQYETASTQIDAARAAMVGEFTGGEELRNKRQRLIEVQRLVADDRKRMEDEMNEHIEVLRKAREANNKSGVEHSSAAEIEDEQRVLAEEENALEPAL